VNSLLERIGVLLHESERRCPRLIAVAGALVPVVFLLPFLNKAYHIDDTLFVYAAQHILKAPFDFYGLTVHWYVTPQPMSEVMQNPPLQSYILALAGGLFGWHEYTLHSAMLLPAFFACFFAARLGQRFGVSPFWAAVGLAFSPCFFVSATQVMCDVTFLALYLGAIYGWIRGLDSNDHRLLAIAALGAAAAFLTKYFGLSLLPLLCVYTVLRAGNAHGIRERIGDCAWLVLPLATLAFYEVYTARLYGTGLFTDAIRYARTTGEVLDDGLVLRSGKSMVYLAACLTLPAAWSLYGIYRAGRAGKIAVLALLLGIFIFLLVGGLQYKLGDGGVSQLQSAQWGGWLVLGIVLLIPLYREWRGGHSDARLLLTLWILGTLVFACCFNHYLNARVLLPLAPALVIVALRNMPDTNTGRRFLIVSALVLGASTLYIAAADQRLANSGRLAAREALSQQDHGANIWFTGHWGFQYYMERGGARAVDFERWSWDAGDLLVLPKNNGSTLSLPERLMQRYEVRAYPVLQGVTTSNSDLGAGFYADSIGPLPYFLGPAAAEQYGLVWLSSME